MIYQRTGLDECGVRHVVLLLQGYTVAAKACGAGMGLLRERLDSSYEVITCVECLVRENGLVGYARR